MSTMLAATYLQPHEIQPRETPVPRPGQGEALVRVHACGVCGSDLAIVSGKHPRARPPLIIGHELGGEVVSVPRDAGEGLKVGDRVTVFPLLSCGQCHACRHGLGHVCRTLRVVGFDRDGGMASHLAVPAGMLVRLPETMSYETGALVEPLSVAVHAVGRSPVETGSRVAVLGAGPIGLLTGLVLKRLGVERLFVTDVDGYRLQVARSLGLEALDARETDVVGHVRDASEGEGADVVFEAAGVPESARQMTELLRPRGTAVVVSVFKEPPLVDLRAVNFKELSLLGARVYAREDFERAIRIAEDLPLDRIVSHRLPIERVADAFGLIFEGRRVCKVLVLPGGEADGDFAGRRG